MKSWRLRVLIAIRLVKRQAQRTTKACAPFAERASTVAVRLVGTWAGEDSPTITRHVVAAGVAAAIFATAECVAGPGVAELLKVGCALVIGAIAVSAGICVARRCAGTQPARALILTTTARVAPKHCKLLAATALRFACEPRSVLALVQGDLATARYVTKIALARGTRAVPLLGHALEVIDACQTTLASARFVHDFEAAAVALCAAQGPIYSAAATSAR